MNHALSSTVPTHSPSNAAAEALLSCAILAQAMPYSQVMFSLLFSVILFLLPFGVADVVDAAHDVE